ncbi:2'-5'-oligoadenylate synthase 1A [Patella vulgata]|uniref:2'-5'-oligoadenylate synthase 1A n=1 Tax=Patella vulgata TaxID=6465 RepID=UPI00217F7E41|nr:2'-5'-oligoadenylate synthase 1A [Patella vulgata]XP_050405316.1 2'-5'-oligoadenylate synthase 1A [Patella vulgata]XP_050405317.1 2'-5'-oligoadenylate synthase 1A [Patella vulgata]XP_050405318.1 2'-5'-oligoadenylate synthase 1A [Patella vulgata]XP_055957222.1 2'-5'-oligoadenylate synthase 1A [Patella vulgata]XP_055957223.1 2'-5'-oligoadenylate synthase 1A [Patella vulgata]
MSLPGYNGGSLEKFIDDVVRPPSGFLADLHGAVDIIVRTLHQLLGYDVQEIVQTGSLGKGTAIQQSCDADLVLFLNGYDSMEAFIEKRQRILADIEKWLDRRMDNIRMTIKKRSMYGLTYNCEVTYSGKTVKLEMDLLPAIDVFGIKTVGERTIRQVYEEMKSKPEKVRSNYSLSFCKKQKAIFRPENAKVKDLIRLLKYWKKTNSRSGKDWTLSSYCCEVIGVYVYCERLNKKTDFKMIDGFRFALEILSEFKIKRLTVSHYYDPNETEWMNLFPMSVTCILDPANPFSNTGPKENEIKKIKRCAAETLTLLPH